MASVEAQEAVRELAASKNIEEILNTPIEEQRRTWEEACIDAVISNDIKVVETQVAGVKAEWLVPEKAKEDQLIFYFHGGGLNQGSIITHRKFCSQIAEYSGIKVLLHDYPLAPEYPYPAALNAASRMYDALLQQGYKAENILFGSDSSGSTLSLALMLQLRDQGLSLPKASFHFSPMIDYQLSGASMVERKDRDPQIFKEDLEMTADFYCKDSDRKKASVSPVFGDFTGFPPILIHVGSEEILWSDSKRLAEKCEQVGVETEFKTWEGLWHVFQTRVETVPEARESLRLTADFLKRWLNRKC